MIYSGLFTDFYELTMMQGYFHQNRNPVVVFDVFFRKNPFEGGYAVFAGLEQVLCAVEKLNFSSEDIDYLRSLKLFNDDFLHYLSNYSFSGNIYSVPEGTVVFSGEPILKVEAPLIDAQLIEGLVLNQINYQTLIATKTSRVYLSSNRGSVVEFGLRRAQGFDGAMTASRAAYIGGACSTSNTLAGKRYGIPVTGTMAHSWIMAFDSELEAFRRFSEIYPENTILLIDTYDSLGSGIENAIKVGLEQKKNGKKIGVRLDSGDLAYLSTEVRKRLDHAGLKNAIIAASNELDEHIISQLCAEKVPIDLWGVGTRMVTGGSDSSLTGVYKLAARDDSSNRRMPTMKVSNNPDKITNPGDKQLYRFYASNGAPVWDLICLADEPVPGPGSVMLYHPLLEYKKFKLKEYDQVKPLLERVMVKGKPVKDLPSLEKSRANCLSQLDSLDHCYSRLVNPHDYKVSISEKLKEVKFALLAEYDDQGIVNETTS